MNPMCARSVFLHSLFALALASSGSSSATPQVLVDAAGGQAKSFHPPPTVSRKRGEIAWRGASEWKMAPREGIFTLTFRFLGFESARQEDLIVLFSGKSPLRVNSARFGLSGRTSRIGNRPDFTVTSPVPAEFSLTAGQSVNLVAGDGKYLYEPSISRVQAIHRCTTISQPHHESHHSHTQSPVPRRTVDHDLWMRIE